MSEGPHIAKLVRAPFPEGNTDERELLLSWLGFLRGAVLRKIDGLTEDDARWTPSGRLISLLGIVNHLTRLEWRWIDGAMRGEDTSRDTSEFYPGPELTVAVAIDAYRDRAVATDSYVRATPLDTPLPRGQHRSALGPAPPHQRDRASCGARRLDTRVARRDRRRIADRLRG
jgi:hypothetical protein